LALLAAAPAGAAASPKLSKTTAKAAALAAVKRLAVKREGDTAKPRFTGPTCRRRSRRRFVCVTTIRGFRACQPADAECDGPAAWELNYEITVKYRSARTTRLSVAAKEV
jgi:hypothetical protein